MNPRSALYDAVLEHERYAPAHNAFRYRIYQLLLDLDELDELAQEIPFLSVDRRNLVEVRAADHIGDPKLSIRDNLRAWLDARGVAVPDGRIQLLTHARTFGYVFNPVSFYFVRNPDDTLAVRRGRGAQHVRRALALPAGRARTSTTTTGACASARRSASTSRRSCPSPAPTSSCSASPASD